MSGANVETPNKLADVLTSAAKRQGVISDCTKLVDEEVKAKSGLSGLAIKGAYAVVKAIKPGIMAEAIDSLLDGFVAGLEPFFAEYKNNGTSQPFSATLLSKKSAVADALLHYTDEKAEHSKNQTMKKAYLKLRATAKEQVVAAVPGLATLIDRHLGR